MSLSIALEVRRALDLRAHLLRRRLYIYRLFGQVRLKQPKGWSEPLVAIVDTGAPYSVIPRFGMANLED